ncbi:MAG: glycosyltransferase, partial [Pseudomonadota bacterium]|nr:glycosyltransferase [Pseudomonadota bacterium]
MRICLVIEAFAGGAGRHVIDLAGRLKACGHEVHLIYSPSRPDANVVSELAGLSIDSQTVLSMRRAPGPWDIPALFRLWRTLRRLGPFDIIHAHCSKAGALTRLAGLFLSGKIVYTPHGFGSMEMAFSVPVRKTYAVIERFLAPLARAIVVLSSVERDHARSIGLPMARVHVAPNGLRTMILPNRAVVLAELDLNEDDVCAGFIGRMVPAKDPQMAIRAFAAAASRVPNLKLALIGEGDLLDEVRAIAEREGVADRVLWLGARSGRELMPAFDMFLLSSRNEGFPYVLLEALDAGLPIVTTDVGGVAETVTDGSNGFVATDAAGLAESMVRLAQDASLRCSMTSRSKEKSAEFTLDVLVE